MLGAVSAFGKRGADVRRCDEAARHLTATSGSGFVVAKPVLVSSVMLSCLLRATFIDSSDPFCGLERGLVLPQPNCWLFEACF